MAKKSTNRIIMIFEIFWEGITIYCKYLDTFLKYMFFPVFGQIIGLALIFTANYFFIVNIPSLIKQYPLLDNIPLVFTLLLLCVAPGFLIFSKAFYDYLVAIGSLNSMVYVSRGDKMKNKPLDTKAHDDVLKKRIGKYIVFLLLLTILMTIGMFPLFIIPFVILCVYFSLVFQVFMLEENVTPISVFQRSFHLVKTNFGITFLLLTLSFVLTYWLLPNLILFGAEKGKIVYYLTLPVQKYIDILPINDIVSAMWANLLTFAGNISSDIEAQMSSLQGVKFDINNFVDTFKFAQDIVKSGICVTVTALLLPMRSAWFTLLYKTFDFEKTEELRKSDCKKGK